MAQKYFSVTIPNGWKFSSKSTLLSEGVIEGTLFFENPNYPNVFLSVSGTKGFSLIGLKLLILPFEKGHKFSETFFPIPLTTSEIVGDFKIENFVEKYVENEVSYATVLSIISNSSGYIACGIDITGENSSKIIDEVYSNFIKSCSSSELKDISLNPFVDKQ